MEFFISLLIIGILQGGLYMMVALGIVVIFKCSGVFNLCQGELMLLGALVAYTFLIILHFPIWLSFLLVIVSSALVGWLVERLVLRPMIGQSIISTVIITLALGMVIRGTSLLSWGATWKTYTPPLLPRGVISWGDMPFTLESIYSFIIAIFLCIFSILFFRYTRLGLLMRATAEDHQVSRGLGISVKQIFYVSWVIAALLASIGGILFSSMSGISLTLPTFGLKCLAVVMVGGLDSIPGAMLAGLMIGVLESLTAGYITPFVWGIKEVAPFIIMIIVLVIRPEGLFGLKRIERI